MGIGVRKSSDKRKFAQPPDSPTIKPEDERKRYQSDTNEAKQ